jgi:RNA polymerase sigma factor (sigma-70 family)
MDTTQSVSNSPGSTSSGFLERLKTQDPQAWQQLADVYGPLVYFWCRKYGVKSEDAADVFQEVFGSVAAAIARFHPQQQGGRFRGWLWTITRRKIQDHYRLRLRRGQALCSVFRPSDASTSCTVFRQAADWWRRSARRTRLETRSTAHVDQTPRPMAPYGYWASPSGYRDGGEGWFGRWI